MGLHSGADACDGVNAWDGVVSDDQSKLVMSDYLHFCWSL